MDSARRLLAIGATTMLLLAGTGSPDRSDALGSSASPRARVCPKRQTSPSAPTPPVRAPEKTRPHFRPATYREDDHVVMPVTFPDGSTAELVYAPALDLTTALIVPNWSGTVTLGEDGASSDFLVRYGSVRRTFARFGQLVSTERGAKGATACIYHLDPPLDRDYLVYQFDHWVVGVHSADSMTPDVRRAWAAGLTGRRSPDGFLVLGTTGAVKFGSGLGGLPEIGFQKDGPGIEITLGACRPDQPLYESGELEGYGRRCVPGTDVLVTVGGYGSLPVDEVLQGLDVRNVNYAAR